jgi:hypothetical protein
VALAAGAALGVSIVRRKAGVAGERARVERRSARVAAMTGIDRRPEGPDPTVPEFPPALDLIAPLVGIPGLVAAGIAAGDPALLSVARVLVGAAFLGAISDGMLLGHWYLVQPGLARRPLLEMVRWTGLIWPLEIAVMLWPVGCAVTTIGLVVVTRAALRERYYSAVMAATGLLYLAILTAFGTDLVARAVLAG